MTAIDLPAVTDKDLRDLFRDLRDEGELIGLSKRGSGHLAIQLRTSNGPVIISNKSSEGRTLRNVKAELRRHGVDVPHQNGKRRPRSPVIDAAAGWPSKLREARLRMGMSQKDLSGLIGYSHAMVGHWEVGRFNPPQAARQKLNEYLGIVEQEDGSVALLDMEEIRDEPEGEPEAESERDGAVTVEEIAAAAEALQQAEPEPEPEPERPLSHAEAGFYIEPEEPEPEPESEEPQTLALAEPVVKLPRERIETVETVLEDLVERIMVTLKDQLNASLREAYTLGTQESAIELEKVREEKELVKRERDDAVTLRAVVFETVEQLRALAKTPENHAEDE